jgi:hypothetical protein
MRTQAQLALDRAFWSIYHCSMARDSPLIAKVESQGQRVTAHQRDQL